MTPNIEKVLSAIQTLSNDEIRELRDKLDKILARPQMTEEEFDQHLLAKGIISKIPPPITDFTPYENRKPAEILDGKPISETLIEERR